MTLHLSSHDIRQLATDHAVLTAARSVLRAESAGRTELPPRIDVPSGAGFLRVMPAVLDDVMGVKIMTLVEGVGNRYLVLMYDTHTGHLRAVLDADELTRLRTAACTLVAGELLGAHRHAQLGLIGSGFEAAGHLRLMALQWRIKRVRVYSRAPQRRIEFARRMADELDIDVEAVNSASEAIDTAPVAVLATKAREPVVDGSAFTPGAVVLSIGSTRPDLRELDRATLARAGTLLVDDHRQVQQESGDIIDALSHHALTEDRIVPASRASADPATIRRDEGRDLLVFKSVGTALQDLALARVLVDAAHAADRDDHAGGDRDLGRDLGELCSLKRPPTTGTSTATTLAETDRTDP